MANKHFQQHNVWPLSYATLASVVTFIFATGVFYSQMTDLRNDFREFKDQTNAKLEKLEHKIEATYISKDDELVVLNKNNQVLGVATTEANLKITPSPTLRPRPATNTPNPTP